MKKEFSILIATLILFISCTKDVSNKELDNDLYQKLTQLNQKYSTKQQNGKTQWVDIAIADFLGFLGGGSLCGPWCGVAFGVGFSALLLETNPGYSTTYSNANFNNFESYSWFNETLLSDLSEYNEYSNYGVYHNVALDIFSTEINDFNNLNPNNIYDMSVEYFEFLKENENSEIDIQSITNSKDEFLEYYEASEQYSKSSFDEMKDFVNSMQNQGLISNEEYIILSMYYIEMIYLNLNDLDLDNYTKEFLDIVNTSDISDYNKEMTARMISFTLHSYSYWQ
ncbi:MAG: hypothetical protein LRY27_00165 [Chitinophagales bacterium]|nr:hypothetical protein [Chitinophagales bacterium]